jgi:hypothetical protein
MIGLLAILGACKKVEPIPPDLDALVHDLWRGYDSATDGDVAANVEALEGLVDGADLEEVSDGSISVLTTDDMSELQVSGDPQDAMGVYMVGPIDCSLEHLETIVTYREQDALYEGIYDTYAREMTADEDDYHARVIPVLTWTTDYAASVLGASYSATSYGSLRYVADTPFGPALLARGYFQDPARFDSDSKSWDQDYQLEVYYELGGHIVHVYAVWRQADFGTGFTSDDEGVQRILLNNLASWDQDTNDLCAEGRP